MTGFFLFILLIIVIIIIVNKLLKSKASNKFVIGKAKWQEIDSTQITHQGVVIDEKKMLKSIEEELINSRFFINIGIEDFFLAIRKTKTQKFMSDEPCINIETKKSYGINTRLKISQKYFNLLTDEGKHLEDPKEMFNNIYYKYWHIAYREKDIKNIKEAGFNKVKISFVYECAHAKKLENKIFNINELPSLPFDDCDADFCRCTFSPVS